MTATNRLRVDKNFFMQMGADVNYPELEENIFKVIIRM